MVKLTAPGGYKIRDIRTGNLYSEIVCTEGNAKHYEVTDESTSIIEEPVTVTPIADRVTDLEDAVIELAGMITDGGG